MTYQQVADILKISRQAVHDTEKRALKKIKAAIMADPELSKFVQRPARHPRNGEQ